jgi:hypothetical protein
MNQDEASNDDVEVWTAGPTGTDLVTGTGTSRTWRVGADWNIDNWLTFLENGFEFGNSEKWGFAGLSFLRKLEELYDDRIRFSWDETQLGLTINSFVSHGVKVNFVREPFFDKFHPRDMLLVDMEHVRVGTMTDITVENDIQAKGDRVRRGQLYADVSGEFKFINSHAYLTGMDA